MAKNIIVENGKTFDKVGGYYMRVHDKNYQGKRTTYRRCNVCKKLIGKQWEQYHRSIHGNNCFYKP